MSSATRSELLATRAQLLLAQRGQDLLGDKRKELVRALQQIADGVLTTQGALEVAAVNSRQTLGVAVTQDGPEATESAGWAAEGDLLFAAGSESIMGVQVPSISRPQVGRPRAERGYGLSVTTPRTDAVAERFEAQVDLILDLAANELRLRRLAEEIAKTTRRLNALRHLVVPRLERQRAWIELVLQERERENQVHLRRLKSRERRCARPSGGNAP